MPENKKLAKRIEYISKRYTIRDEVLYKKGYVLTYLTCFHLHQAHADLSGIHQGLCGGHPTAKSLAMKVGRHGYSSPTICGHPILRLSQKSILSKNALASKSNQKHYNTFWSLVTSPLSPYHTLGSTTLAHTRNSKMSQSRGDTWQLICYGNKWSPISFFLPQASHIDINRTLPKGIRHW